MKFSLVVVAVTAFAAVAVVQAETPSLRRMDESTANIAAGAPHAGDAQEFISPRYCEKFPNAPICTHLFKSEPETRSADAAVGAPHVGDAPEFVSPAYCEKFPNAPICTHLRN